MKKHAVLVSWKQVFIDLCLTSTLNLWMKSFVPTHYILDTLYVWRQTGTMQQIRTDAPGFFYLFLYKHDILDMHSSNRLCYFTSASTNCKGDFVKELSASYAHACLTCSFSDKELADCFQHKKRKAGLLPLKYAVSHIGEQEDVTWVLWNRVIPIHTQL